MIRRLTNTRTPDRCPVPSQALAPAPGLFLTLASLLALAGPTPILAQGTPGLEPPAAPATASQPATPQPPVDLTIRR
jgi:hypothetical protein